MLLTDRANRKLSICPIAAILLAVLICAAAVAGLVLIRSPWPGGVTAAVGLWFGLFGLLKIRWLSVVGTSVRVRSLFSTTSLSLGECWVDVKSQLQRPFLVVLCHERQRDLMLESTYSVSAAVRLAEQIHHTLQLPPPAGALVGGRPGSTRIDPAIVEAARRQGG